MLIDKLNQLLLVARKSGDKEASLFYSTFLGDCQQAAKPPLKEITDDIILSIGKAWRKSIEKNVILASEMDCETFLEKSNSELRLLEDLLPEGLKEGELMDIVLTYIEDGHTTLGSIMKKLKQNYANLYDGRIASRIVKELLA